MWTKTWKNYEKPMVSQGKFTHQSSTGLVALRDHVQKVGKRHVNQCHVIFLRFFGLVNWSRVLSVFVGQISRTVRDMNSGMGCQCFGGILSMDGDITRETKHSASLPAEGYPCGIELNHGQPRAQNHCMVRWGVSPSGVPLASHGEVKRIFPIPLMDSSMGKLIDMSRIVFTTLNIRQIITTVTHPILTIVV